jgi:hypothetical protein
MFVVNLKDPIEVIFECIGCASSPQEKLVGDPCVLTVRTTDPDTVRAYPPDKCPWEGPKATWVLKKNLESLTQRVAALEAQVKKLDLESLTQRVAALEAKCKHLQLQLSAYVEWHP